MELAKIYEHEAELRIKQLETLSVQRYKSNADVAAITRLQDELNSLLVTFEACVEIVQSPSSPSYAVAKCKEYGTQLEAITRENGNANDAIAMEADLANLDSVLALAKRAEAHGNSSLTHLAQQSERLQGVSGGLHAIDHHVNETHKGLTRINHWWNSFAPG